MHPRSRLVYLRGVGTKSFKATFIENHVWALRNGVDSPTEDKVLFVILVERASVFRVIKISPSSSDVAV